MAKTAYSTPQATVRTPRSIEYELLARVTARLNTALVEKMPFAALVAALHDNRKLWRALAADLAEPGNALPQPLRAQLFYLAEFTRIHTGQVMKGAADTQVLIDINTAVMRGLCDVGSQP